MINKKYLDLLYEKRNLVMSSHNIHTGIKDFSSDEEYEMHKRLERQMEKEIALIEDLIESYLEMHT